MEAINFNNPFKYEYLLITWGGFYNERFKSTHKLEEGYYYFDSLDERTKCISKLIDLESELNARHLMISLHEGFNVRVITTLHRIISYKNKQYYSSYELSPCYPYSVAKYHLENKWYPGFNDYPLGEEFDYSKVKIVSQWITGNFEID